MEERHLNEIRIFLNALIEMVKFLFLGNMELGWEQSRWICTATERTITRTFRWISFMLENFLLKKECEKCYSYLPIWGQWLYLWFVSMNALSLFWLHSNFLFIILFFFNYYLKVFWHLFILPAWAIKFRTLKLEANICSIQNDTNYLHKVWIRVTICCAAKCGICE